MRGMAFVDANTRDLNNRLVVSVADDVAVSLPINSIFRPVPADFVVIKQKPFHM